ncbi:hypothetical protein BB561_000759 [Smittium simulii]|uniref:Uncharacterized protein n=1 Tax=Smittium simulii TaxID=133385 RepID=A0A2T9YXQ2_9FUNG|nr:hypothetical protein BB561_000759 [Smittium simulii]
MTLQKVKIKASNIISSSKHNNSNHHTNFTENTIERPQEFPLTYKPFNTDSNICNRNSISSLFNPELSTSKPSVLRSRDNQTRVSAKSLTPNASLQNTPNAKNSANLRSASSNSFAAPLSSQQFSHRSLSSLKKQNFPSINENESLKDSFIASTSHIKSRPMSMQHLSGKQESEQYKNRNNFFLNSQNINSALPQKNSPTYSHFQTSQKPQVSEPSLSKNLSNLTINTTIPQRKSDNFGVAGTPLMHNDQFDSIKRNLLKSNTCIGSEFKSISRSSMDSNLKNKSINQPTYNITNKTLISIDHVPTIEEFQAKYSKNINRVSNVQSTTPESVKKFSNSDVSVNSDYKYNPRSPINIFSSQNSSYQPHDLSNDTSTQISNKNSDILSFNESTFFDQSKNTFQLGEVSMEAAEARVGRKNQLKYVSHLENKLKNEPGKQVYIYLDDSGNKDPDEVFDKAVKDDVEFQKLLSTIEGLIKRTEDAIEYKSANVAKVISSIKYNVGDENNVLGQIPSENNINSTPSNECLIGMADNSAKADTEKYDENTLTSKDYPELINGLKKENNQLKEKLLSCRELVNSLVLPLNNLLNYHTDNQLQNSSSQKSTPQYNKILVENENISNKLNTEPSKKSLFQTPQPLFKSTTFDRYDISPGSNYNKKIKSNDKKTSAIEYKMQNKLPEKKRTRINSLEGSNNSSKNNNSIEFYSKYKLDLAKLQNLLE